MPVRFGTMNIPGIVLAPGPQYDEPRLLMREAPRWGVWGLEVITSRLGAAGLTMPILLHGGNSSTHTGGWQSSDELWEMLERLRKAAGTSGDVTYTTRAMSHRFPDCIFLGARPTGSEADGPVKDTAGALDGGFWQVVHLSWLQTRIIPNAYVVQ